MLSCYGAERIGHGFVVGSDAADVLHNEAFYADQLV